MRHHDLLPDHGTVRLELNFGVGPDHDEVSIGEFHDRPLGPVAQMPAAEFANLIYVRETHLPALAALVANRCADSPTADHHDTLVTCLQTLVERGALGPGLGCGGNDRAIRSWLDQAGIPYRRTESVWASSTLPQEWDVPN